MSEQTTPPRRRLREHVAEELRVVLARRKMSGAELARRTGIKQSTMSRRMTGETAFDMDDLEAIAAVLDIKVGDLFPEGGSSRDFDLAPAGATATVGHSFVSLAKGVTGQPQPRTTAPPNSQGRTERSRPVSAVPARKRRPRPVFLGDQARSK